MCSSDLFACALALQGHLAGRKVECLDGIRTNTYIIMLAPSGSGKNHPRRIIRKILSRIGLGDEVFEDAVVDRAIAEEIFREAKALPQETYRTFVLFYGFELTISEIAEKLGVTKETVKTRLYRARNTLRAKLNADSQQDRQTGEGEH